MGWGDTNGLLGGLAQGIQQGLITYQTMKGIQNENKKMSILEEHYKQQIANEKAKTNAGLLEHDYTPVRDENGNVIMDEQLGLPKVTTDTARLKAKADANPLNALNAEAKKKDLAKPVFNPAEQEIEKKAGSEIAEWNQSGKSTAASNLTNVRQAIAKLESGIAKTGTATASMSKIPFLGAYIDPDVTSVKDALEKAVQGSLKATLGAQFTEREGAGIMKRTFSVDLPPEENIRRAKLLINELGSIAEIKQQMADYVAKNGMIRGFNGPSVEQLEARMAGFNVEPNKNDKKSGGLVGADKKSSGGGILTKEQEEYEALKKKAGL